MSIDLFVQELEICGALILGFSSLRLIGVLIGVPVGFVIVPLIILTVVIRRLEMEVIAESVLAVWRVLASLVIYLA
jgi:hypothetical protein